MQRVLDLADAEINRSMNPSDAMPTDVVEAATRAALSLIEVAPLQGLIAAFARSREKAVQDGRESRKLASLLVDEYGRGVADAAAVLFDSKVVAGEISAQADKAAAVIDPHSRGNANARYKAVHVDVVGYGPPATGPINSIHKMQAHLSNGTDAVGMPEWVNRLHFYLTGAANCHDCRYSAVQPSVPKA